MNKRRTRLQAILEILTNNVIGSQDELSRLLSARGFVVTQATLSRDLKTLRTTKVATDFGGYRYVVMQPGEVPVDEVWEAVPSTAQSGTHNAVTSIAIAGNILVIKTRTGYASGLAYDIDQLDSPYLLGTISGADTVIAVINDKYPVSELLDYFQGFLPDIVIEKAREQFL
jgi:transcriptional regulator of arginine metabolism